MKARRGLEKLILGADVSIRYLGFEARHEVGYKVLYTFEGIEEEIREYHYELDNARILYAAPGAHVAVSIPGVCTITHGIEHMFLIYDRMERRDMFVQNPLGAFRLSEAYPVGTEGVFQSPGFSRYVHFEFPVSGQVSFRLGHHWSRRSVLDESLTGGIINVQPYRNFYCGVSWKIKKPGKENRH